MGKGNKYEWNKLVKNMIACTGKDNIRLIGMWVKKTVASTWTICFKPGLPGVFWLTLSKVKCPAIYEWQICEHQLATIKFLMIRLEFEYHTFHFHH